MRVEQTSSFLLDIVRGAGQGRYGLAPFQRQYVWDREDVEKLLKSLVREWPIGSFTLWTPPSADRELYPTKGRLGPIEHDESVSTLILDGQNRISTLIYASLVQTAPAAPAHPYSPEEIAVWFGDEVLVADYETKSITFMHPDEAWSATRVPFGNLMDCTVLRRARPTDLWEKAISGYGMQDDALNWLLDELPGRVREARVPITNLRDATLEEARDCYMTICRAGQPITDHEFDFAFTYAGPSASNNKGPKP